jgi:predicted aconitase with swiveling domain
MKSLEIMGRPLVSGEAEGKLLVTNQPLSFWGGVNQFTSEIIDRRHELSGCFLKDRIFLFCGSKGSSTGSMVLLELLYKGIGPRGIVVTDLEVILTIGAIVGQEFFSIVTPIIQINREDFVKTYKYGNAHISPDGRLILYQ